MVYGGYGPTAGQQGATRQGTDPGISGAATGAPPSQYDLIGQLQQILSNPQFAQGQMNFDSILGSLFQNTGMYDWQAGNLQTNADFSLRELGLEGQGLDIQRASLGRQAPLLNQEWDISNQQYQTQLQGLDQAVQESWQGAGRATRGLGSQETARGAFGSQGHHEGLQDISTQLKNSLSTIDRERTQLNLGHQSSQLQYQEQLAKIGDAEKQLDLSSQRLGLSKEEITSRLNQSLQQLGLGTVLDSTSLLSEIAKMERGDYSPLSSMIGEIYAYSGLNLFGDTSNG